MIHVENVIRNNLSNFSVWLHVGGIVRSNFIIPPEHDVRYILNWKILAQAIYVPTSFSVTILILSSQF